MTRRRESNRRDSPSQPDMVRTFICIEVPETIKSRIQSLQQQLRHTEAQVSWTRPANIHLTIKFLGDVEESRLETVCEAVERAAGPISEFDIEVRGAGCFPSARSPRVLWVGLGQLPDELRDIHRNIEEELWRKGFEREQKRFSPHLTIARVRAASGAQSLAEKLIAVGFEPETFRASEVIVMRSELRPTGSIYTPQAVIKLGRSKQNTGLQKPTV